MVTFILITINLKAIYQSSFRNKLATTDIVFSVTDKINCLIDKKDKD